MRVLRYVCIGLSWPGILALAWAVAAPLGGISVATTFVAFLVSVGVTATVLIVGLSGARNLDRVLTVLQGVLSIAGLLSDTSFLRMWSWIAIWSVFASASVVLVVGGLTGKLGLAHLRGAARGARGEPRVGSRLNP